MDVWPETWQAFTVFCGLRTQWRVGGTGGATGLDYNILFHRLDRMGLTHSEYEQLEADIHVMEVAALGAMRETNKA